MFTVALVGADGAGKTTVSQKVLEQPELPFKVKYIYMGINPSASNVVLPTTRLIIAIKRALGKSYDQGGPPDPTKSKTKTSKKGIRGFLSGCKSSLRLLNQLAEECFRQCVIWYYQYQGYVVLFDRHFFIDYYAHDIVNSDPNRPFTSKIHGFFLKHFYPRPDVVLFLDAPSEVLFARKGEGTIELLDSRRQEYRQIQDEVKKFMVVDASQSLEAVTEEVIELIGNIYQARTGSLVKVQHE